MKRLFFLLVMLVLMTSSMPTPPAANGAKAPDFSLETPKGKTISLSKLKGKVVLIDFWASWCGPCRKENPNVVEAYAKYHKKKFKNGKGFEIISVSLDRDVDKWKEGITADNLSWKYHGWDKEGIVSKLYGVNSIPKAFLVDGDGVIIASGEDVRGLKLHITLDGLLE